MQLLKNKLELYMLTWRAVCDIWMSIKINTFVAYTHIYLFIYLST